MRDRWEGRRNKLVEGSAVCDVFAVERAASRGLYSLQLRGHALVRSLVNRRTTSMRVWRGTIPRGYYAEFDTKLTTNMSHVRQVLPCLVVETWEIIG